MYTARVWCCSVKPVIRPVGGAGRNRLRRCSAIQNRMSTGEQSIRPKVIDSHLHVWASPVEAAEKYPYFPGQEPTLPGHVGFLLQCMEEAGVDGALIVQPINHKFDHSYLTSVLKEYPSKFAGCCLANPAENGCGIKDLENLVLEDGYCAVRFNPYLWPPGQKMTNDIGKALFSRAGELGVPVGFMCMKGLNLHIEEIKTLCSEFPSTVVLLDHMAFCKPPINEGERQNFSNLLDLSKFPQRILLISFLVVYLRFVMLVLFLQTKMRLRHSLKLVLETQVYIKFSALFRLSRTSYPYDDLSKSLSQVVSSYGANRVMWGSDFPFVVPECGYKEAKEAVSKLAEQISLSYPEMESIMGNTVQHIFKRRWHS